MDEIAKVEKIVVEKVGSIYGDALEKVVRPFSPDKTLNSKLRGNWVIHLATASARERAEACWMVLQEKTND